MIRILALTGLALAVFAAPAVAQNVEVIKERKALFEKMGKAAKDPGKMLKQEIPFDAAIVEAALDTFIATAPQMAEKFPEDAKTGGETEALPAIWENKENFDQRFKDLVTSAEAAKGQITDEFALMETWPKVVGNCGGCHKKYREKKD